MRLPGKVPWRKQWWKELTATADRFSAVRPGTAQPAGVMRLARAGET